MGSGASAYEQVGHYIKAYDISQNGLIEDELKKLLKSHDVNKPTDHMGCYWCHANKEAREKKDPTGAFWKPYHGGFEMYCVDETDYDHQNTLKNALNGIYCPWTALQYASALGKDENVRWLLSHGANPNIKDRLGRNSLEIAQLLNRTTVVQILTEKK
jgi:hypothetical protein